MSVRKHVVLLVGAKGAGKSTLGALAAARFGAAHVEPEALWIAHARAHAGPRDAAFERAGYARVVAAVADALADHDLVVTDTTAASSETPAFVLALRRLARVSIVRVEAAAPTCLSRIRSRDESAHLPADDARIAEVRMRSLSAPLAVDAVLDNEAHAEPDVLEARLRALLARFG